MTEASSDDQFGERTENQLEELFQRAKARDEFEYACALLRIRGLEGPGWDPLEETNRLFSDMTRLLQAPLEAATKLRIGLFTYCHLIEVDAIYSIIENMLLARDGERCSAFPFGDLYRDQPRKYSRTPPSAARVVRFVIEHAVNSGASELGDVLKEMFNDQVRNSFFHSDYIFFDDEYRSREAEFESGGVIQKSLKISELLEVMNRGYAFYQAFMGKYWKHRMSYAEDKQISGRLGSGGEIIPVLLKADEARGLYGFEA